MSEKRLKTLNLDQDAVETLDAQPNASQYARMAIKRYRELLNETAHLTLAVDRNWQDLKLACSIIRMILADCHRSRLPALLDALDMNDLDIAVWEAEEDGGRGVDYIIGRVRLLGLRERI